MVDSSAAEQAQGTCLVVSAACVFALVALVVKKDPLPVLLATECRFLVSWLVSIAFMLMYRTSRGLYWFGPPELRGWLLLKCAMSFAFITLWWSALRRAPVGDCIAIIYTSPILTSMLSRLALKESLPKQFPLRVALVSIGTILVLDPPFIHTLLFASLGGSSSTTPSSPDHDYTLVFLSLIAAAIVPIFTRKARDCSWIEVEHVSACLASTVLTPALLLCQYFLTASNGSAVSTISKSYAASPSEVGLIVLAAGGSFVGIAMETKGYQLAEVGKASMFRYVEVPFAYVLQRFATTEPVRIQAVLGSILIIASCFLGLEQSKPKEIVQQEDSKTEALLGA
jgi:drug/metabolite transporter (DMT)-like permease